jgi:hypothetical protein
METPLNDAGYQKNMWSETIKEEKNFQLNPNAKLETSCKPYTNNLLTDESFLDSLILKMWQLNSKDSWNWVYTRNFDKDTWKSGITLENYKPNT